MTRYWCLSVAPFIRVLPGLVFDDQCEAKEKAREENKIGIWKGKGVKAVRCDENGNILIKTRT